MATCPKCRSRYSDEIKSCSTDGESLLPDDVVARFDDDLPGGTVVGEYHIEKKIGEGGFGKVYSATHPVIGKRAAIKVLNQQFSSNAQVVSRFVEEARAVNKIRHRHIVDIFAFGTLPSGHQWFAMELLDGMPLSDWLSQNGRMKIEQALPVLRQVGRALDAAHAVGIAHRDLKPDNVFLTFDEDGSVFIKLLDFGIAKLLGESSATHRTRTGASMGTPLYMSPEQCHGAQVDQRTDVYSFGVMTHEILTGRLPFDGTSVLDLMVKHTREAPPPMSQVVKDVPRELDHPVLHMLAKVPAERPATLSEAIQALYEAAARAGCRVSLSQSGPTPVLMRSGERSRRTNAQESAPTLPVGAMTPAPATGSSLELAPTAKSRRAGSTVEGVVSVPRPRSRATWLLAGGAVVALGVVIAVVAGRLGNDAPASAAANVATGAEQPSQTPSASATETASVAPPAGVGTAPAPTATVSAPESGTATAAQKGGGNRPPPPTGKDTPPPPQPKAPPPPDVPDDLPKNPFD
jgi:eukaryotic-like serine/threonine-protein kinase